MIARRAPLLVCALAAVLSLAACTGTQDPAPSTTASSTTESASPSAAPSASSTSSAAPTTSSAPAPSGSASGSEQYLGFVQQFSPTLAALSPDVLLALGQEVCSGFRAGRDAGQVSVSLGNDTRAPDLQASDAAVILGAAVATMCPQYRSRLQD